MGNRLLTTDKKRITRKNSSLVPVLHKIANAILRMTWGMKRFHIDTLADLERFPIRGDLGDSLTALAAYD